MSLLTPELVQAIGFSQEGETTFRAKGCIVHVRFDESGTEAATIVTLPTGHKLTITIGEAGQHSTRSGEPG